MPRAPAAPDVASAAAAVLPALGPGATEQVRGWALEGLSESRGAGSAVPAALPSRADCAELLFTMGHSWEAGPSGGAGAAGDDRQHLGLRLLAGMQDADEKAVDDFEEELAAVKVSAGDSREDAGVSMALAGLGAALRLVAL